jgi:hypothetical protein
MHDRHSIPGRDIEGFSLCYRVQTGPGVHPSSSLKSTVCTFPWAERLGREADNAPPSSAEIKNESSCTTTHPRVFMA